MFVQDFRLEHAGASTSLKEAIFLQNWTAVVKTNNFALLKLPRVMPPVKHAKTLAAKIAVRPDLEPNGALVREVDTDTMRLGTSSMSMESAGGGKTPQESLRVPSPTILYSVKKIARNTQKKVAVFNLSYISYAVSLETYGKP